MSRAFIDEYIAFRGGTVAIAHSQQMRFINIMATEFCNLRCYGCVRYSDSAPSDAMMTVGQVRRFVQESKRLQWPWIELRLYGGEATLHPDFDEILHELIALRDYLPKIRMKVVSNGIGQRVCDALNRVPQEHFQIHTSVSMKKLTRPEVVDGRRVPLIPEFGNVFLAPIDRMNEIDPVHGIIKTCKIHGTCGIELTRNGYVPCGAGGPRILGWDAYVRNLEEVTERWCYEQLRTLCAICGRNLNYCKKFSESTETSPFWRIALDEYGRRVPELPLYPEG